MKRRKIAICGHGQCGKDTAATLFSKLGPFRYQFSTSEMAALHMHNVVMKGKYPSVKACFADRRNHREEWRDAIRAYNGGKDLRLYREYMDTHDIFNGVRNREELEWLPTIVDLVIWVERDVPRDPSNTIIADDCDIVIPNNGTLEALESHISAFCGFLEVGSEYE